MTVTKSNYERSANDLYSTEAWVTEAALRHFPMEGLRVWEPSAGRHYMSDVLKDHGADVWTSDIVTYDREHDQIFDFLSDDQDFEVVDSIFTNPPYGKQNKMAVVYAEKALQRCTGWVLLVLTAKFDFGSTRHHLFRDNPRFHAKIALVDRISWTGDGATGTEDHAVYVWRPRGHITKPPVMIYEGKVRAQ